MFNPFNPDAANLAQDLTNYAVGKVEEARAARGEDPVAEFHAARRGAPQNPLQAWTNAPPDAKHAHAVLGAKGPSGGSSRG